jgi:hypothetical protein
MPSIAVALPCTPTLRTTLGCSSDETHWTRIRHRNRSLSGRRIWQTMSPGAGQGVAQPAREAVWPPARQPINR